LSNFISLGFIQVLELYYALKLEKLFPSVLLPLLLYPSSLSSFLSFIHSFILSFCFFLAPWETLGARRDVLHSGVRYSPLSGHPLLSWGPLEVEAVCLYIVPLTCRWPAGILHRTLLATFSFF